MREKKEKQGWSRREFLTGAGVAIGLPFFPSLFPRTAWADGVTPPARLLFMSVPLGFVPNLRMYVTNPSISGLLQLKEGWFPDDDGPNYTLPGVHTALARYREHFSFLKGLSNQKYRGDPHNADDVFLTGADTFANTSKAFSNTISCDQVAAASKVLGGMDVRHPCLPLGINGGYSSRSGGLSWSEQGVPISPMRSPAEVFDHLFGKDDVPAEVRLLRFNEQKSVLDVTLSQLQDLNRRLNATDRQKLQELTDAVRGVEIDIQREEHWIKFPKPKVSIERPDEAANVPSTHHAKAMFDLAHAAFLTDSTRVITYELPDVFKDITPFGKHSLNHPGGDPVISHDAIKLDAEISNQIAYLLKLLCESKEHDGQPLIHHTLAALGSGVWGPVHSLRSLPVMLLGHGGGRIKQGVTRSYQDDDKRKQGVPLANLWLTMLNASGVLLPENKETFKFADSTGTLDGLMK